MPPFEILRFALLFRLSFVLKLRFGQISSIKAMYINKPDIMSIDLIIIHGIRFLIFRKKKTIAGLWIHVNRLKRFWQTGSLQQAQPRISPWQGYGGLILNLFSVGCYYDEFLPIVNIAIDAIIEHIIICNGIGGQRGDHL